MACVSEPLIQCFFTQVVNRNLSVALCWAPLYVSIASTYLIFFLFLRFISVQFRFQGITLNDCVLQCNIAIFFFVAGLLVVITLLLGIPL